MTASNECIALMIMTFEVGAALEVWFSPFPVIYVVSHSQ